MSAAIFLNEESRQPQTAFYFCLRRTGVSQIKSTFLAKAFTVADTLLALGISLKRKLAE